MPQPFTQRTPRRFVGAYQPRIDSRAKASGQAEYLDDVAAGLKGVLVARALRSPYPHVRITRLDTSKAEAIPGVRCILRYDDPQVADLPQTCLAWTSTNSLSYDRMYYPLVKDVRVLDSTARWVGDEVGCVVAADSEEIVQQALEAIEVEWEQLPFVLDRHEAMEPDAPVIHPEVNPAGNVLPADEFSGPDVYYDKGNVDAGFGLADAVVEVEAHYARSDHSALDSRGCLMQWKNGKLTCWTNYYAADQTRMHISTMLKLPMNRVRVILPFVGGQFGRCNMGEQPFFLETAMLAQRTSRPVRYKMTRREDFHDTRNAIDYKVKIGAKKDGTITAADFDALLDTGAYHGHGLAVTKWVISLDVVENFMAHIPNLRYESYVVYTNKVPGGCMRGAGNVQHNFAWGLAVDAIAQELELDPLDVYLKNSGHEWQEIPSPSLAAVLKEGASRIGWEARHRPGEGPVYDGTKRRGLGMSAHCCWHAPYQELWRGHVQVEIKLNPDMSVVLKAPQGETGTGSNATVTFACAEALSFLGVTPDDIQYIFQADTETGLKDMVQTDSCCSFLQSEMMPRAAEQLKQSILGLAEEPMGAAAADLDIAEGRVFVKADPEKSMSVKEILWSGDFVPLTATVSKLPPAEKVGAPVFAAFAEVEVDTETGIVDVLRIVVVHDCGTVMYASGAEGQQVGGQCLSMGESITEEMFYDEATGVPLNFNWIDYHVPTMLDFPDVDPVLIEVWEGAGEFGACGMGEGTGTCTPRAIYNAVNNAVGVRIEDMPLSPDRVLRALGTIGPGKKGAR